MSVDYTWGTCVMADAAERAGQARYDIETARLLFDTGRYLYVLFCCQQAVKDAQGADSTRQNCRLVCIISCDWRGCCTHGPETPRPFRRLTDFYIASRYPEEIEEAAWSVMFPGPADVCGGRGSLAMALSNAAIEQRARQASGFGPAYAGARWLCLRLARHGTPDTYSDIARGVCGRALRRGSFSAGGDNRSGPTGGRGRY